MDSKDALNQEPRPDTSDYAKQRFPTVFVFVGLLTVSAVVAVLASVLVYLFVLSGNVDTPTNTLGQAAPSESTGIVRVIGTISPLTPNEMATVEVPPDKIREISVAYVRITVLRNTSTAIVTIDKVSQPAGTPSPSEQVFTYLEIAADGISSDDYREVTIAFNVPVYWLQENDVRDDDVVLFRLVDNNWPALETRSMGSSGDLVSYEAISPGLSRFAVGAGSTTREPIDYEKNKIDSRSALSVNTGDRIEFHVNSIHDWEFPFGFFRIEWVEFPGGRRVVKEYDESNWNRNYPDPSYERTFDSALRNYTVQVLVFLDDVLVFRHDWIATVKPPPKPDLIVDSVAVGASSYELGEHVEAEATIKNIGKGDAGRSTISYYLGTSTNRQYYYIEVGRIASLVPQETEKDIIGIIGWKVPADIPPGQYRIWVNANSSDSVDESNKSNNWGSSSSFSISQPNRRPPMPGAIQASGVTTTGARVKWGASNDPDGDAITYYVEYKRDNAIFWTKSGSTKNTYKDITGLASGKAYDVHVRAYDGSEYSKWLKQQRVIKTLQKNSPPPMPGALSASNETPTSARVKWGASNDPDGDAITYYVEYKRDNAIFWTKAGSTKNTYRDITGLASGKAYDVHVRAYDGSEYSKWLKQQRVIKTLRSREAAVKEAQEYNAENPRWWEALPDCPFMEPGQTVLGDGWAYEGPSPKYHPGAAGLYRSYPADPDVHPIASSAHLHLEPGGPGQQCGYDNEGALITEGPGAGTPDRVGGTEKENDDGSQNINFNNFRRHLREDVKAWKVLGWELYNQYWPPNPGRARFGLTINGIQVTGSEMSITNGTVQISSAPNASGNLYSHGTPISLIVTPDDGYLSGACTPAAITMVSNQDVTCSVSQPSTHILRVNSVQVTGPSVSIPGGAVTVNLRPDSPGSKYTAGTKVTLTATPTQSYDFESWSGCDTTIGIQCFLVMDDDKRVTARFTLIPHTNNPPALAVLEFDDRTVRSDEDLFRKVKPEEEISVRLRAQDEDGNLSYVTLLDDEGGVLDRQDCSEEQGKQCTVWLTIEAPDKAGRTMEFEAVAVDVEGARSEPILLGIETKAASGGGGGGGGGGGDTDPPVDNVTIDSGPSGTPDPVDSGGSVSLSVTAADTSGHGISYSWTAICSGLASNGSFSNASLQNPTWTAPANTTGVQQSCTMGVTASDGLGQSDTKTYSQEVDPEVIDSVTIVSGPSGTPDPVDSGGSVSLSVTAADTSGHDISYSWTAICSGLTSNGSFSNASLQNPTWTAPANTTGVQQSCNIEVTASDGLGQSDTKSYSQEVGTEVEFTEVFREDGEGLTDGQAVPGWTLCTPDQPDCATVTATHSVKKIGNAGIRVNGDGVKNRLLPSTLTGRLDVNMWMFPATDSNTNYSFGLGRENAGDPGDIVRIRINETNTWFLNTPAGHGPGSSTDGWSERDGWILGSYTMDWTKVRLVLDSDQETVDVYLDDLQVGFGISTLSEDGLVGLSQGIDLISSHSGRGGGGSDSYFDDLVITSQTYMLTINGTQATSTVIALTNGSVGVSPAPNAPDNRYTNDTEVTLTASPDDGFVFGVWSGDCSGTSIVCNLTMDGDKSVTASFDSEFTEVFREDGEGLTDGQAVPGWTLCTPGQPNCATVAATYSVKKIGSVGIRVNGDGVRNRPLPSPLTGRLDVNVWMFPATDSNTNYSFGLGRVNADDPGDVVTIRINETNTWFLNTPAGHGPGSSAEGWSESDGWVLGSYTMDWTKVRLVLDSDQETVDVYLDDIQVGFGISTLSQDGLIGLSQGIDLISSHSGRGGGGSNSYFDELVITSVPTS